MIHVAPEDIHVYSVDEVMIDATAYLKLYNLTVHEFAKKMIQDVFPTLFVAGVYDLMADIGQGSHPQA